MRVIGLVSSIVEHGHDGVADELFHFPAELTCEQWRRDAPVGIEYSCNLGWRRALGEAREPDEIGKQDTHVLVVLPRPW